MFTPAQVIGHNVKNRREGRMTAEELGEKVAAYLGKPWPRQTVYLLEQGKRRVTADEAIALAHILGTTVADLFTPGPEVDGVVVGDVTIGREELLVAASATEEELFRHFQALLRARRAVEQLTRAENVVLSNLDNVFRGEEPMKPEDVTDSKNMLVQAANWRLLAAMERAAEWYEPEVKPDRPARLPDMDWSGDTYSEWLSKHKVPKNDEAKESEHE